MTNALFDSVNATPRTIWTGISGKLYNFEHFAINGVVFNPVGGVYIFSKQNILGNWNAIYIGETDNFKRRIADELLSHHRWDSIARAGATHISALVVTGGNAERLRIETDLRHALNPPCNRQ